MCYDVTYIVYLVTSAQQYLKCVSQQGFPPDKAHFESVIFQKRIEGTIALVVKELSILHYQYGHIVMPIDMRLQHYPCKFLLLNVAVDSATKDRELSYDNH